MTPILIGRWQSRIFLMGTVGTFVTTFFFFATGSIIPYVILAQVTLAGLGWDVLYDVLQRQRWDHDWPPILQLLTGLLEGVAIFLPLYLLRLIAPLPSPGLFWLHYGLVWLTTFLAGQSIMRILFPRWRYHGGQII